VAANDDVACQELVEIVSDYLEGALPEADRERFDAHLEVCEGCRRYLDQMRTTIRIVGTLTAEDLDPDAKDQLLQLFREWNRGETARRRGGEA
jgi:predicted anti-sigma-YlaC factor YlaD